MKKQNYLLIFLLISFAFIIISFPKKTVDKFRNFSIGSISPFLKIKNKELTKNTNEIFSDSNILSNKLALENTLLKNELNGIYEWLFFENRLDDQIEKYKNYLNKSEKDFLLKDFFLRRAEETKEITKQQFEAIPARVIFRDPSSWSSSLWINVGEKDNENLSKTIVAKNSPVVIGQNLVGVVENVHKNFSRIRLITDSSLIPSVRALRGKSQDISLINLIQSFKDRVFSKNNLFDTEEEKENFINTLNQLSQKLSNGKEDKYLAKGELFGSSEPFWRSKGLILKGRGFNYDYSDEEGGPRDLRTGKIVGDNVNLKSEPLIEVGDLLVTTGMDGVFPKGLYVATVQKIYDLDNGDSSYEIEAIPTVNNLNELDVVMVMPPIGFDRNE